MARAFWFSKPEIQWEKSLPLCGMIPIRSWPILVFGIKRLSRPLTYDLWPTITIKWGVHQPQWLRASAIKRIATPYSTTSIPTYDLWPMAYDNHKMRCAQATMTSGVCNKAHRNAPPHPFRALQTRNRYYVMLSLMIRYLLFRLLEHSWKNSFRICTSQHNCFKWTYDVTATVKIICLFHCLTKLLRTKLFILAAYDVCYPLACLL